MRHCSCKTLVFVIVCCRRLSHALTTEPGLSLSLQGDAFKTCYADQDPLLLMGEVRVSLVTYVLV
jgi:hypothetical protein